jgi:tripartite-type tricarboxylate transporter receptor subunit TctC
MERNRSHLKLALVVTTVLLVIGLPFMVVAEEAFPTKPITLVNPWSVGGGVDTAARALAKEMQKILNGNPVLVESHSGAAGLVGGDYTAKSKPDGYTMGILAPPEFAPEAYTCMRKATYSSKDLEPVVRWMNLPYGLASRTDKPWKNLKEFIKYVQDHPNTVRVGHVGVGYSYHICFYALAKENNLKVIEVPFAGAGPLKVALRGGHIDVGMSSMSAVQGFIQEGTVRMLAIHHHARFGPFPDVPTFQELGFVPGLTYNLKGMWVSKGTPEARKKKLHDVIKQAIETPSFKEFALKNLFDPYYGSPDDLRADIVAENKVVRPLIEEICVKYKK